MREGDFLRWKSEIVSFVWAVFFRVFLKVDEEDDESVVIGEGISLVIWGKLWGDDSIDFL